jgi:hypothetical protein
MVRQKEVRQNKVTGREEWGKPQKSVSTTSEFYSSTFCIRLTTIRTIFFSTGFYSPDGP